MANLFAHSTCCPSVLQASFAGGKKELNVSVYQMCILLQFNDAATLSLDAIRGGATDIPELEFKRHLLSLCTPKLKILKKHSKGKVRQFTVDMVFAVDFSGLGSTRCIILYMC